MTTFIDKQQARWVVAPLAAMTTFIDKQQALWGVAPICRILQVAPPSYYAANTRPTSARAIRDRELSTAIGRIRGAHFGGAVRASCGASSVARARPSVPTRSAT